MSAAKQPRNAKAEYWQAQTADARCSRDRANAKNDLLQARCADMANLLEEWRCFVLHGTSRRYSEREMLEWTAAVLAKAGL